MDDPVAQVGGEQEQRPAQRELGHPEHPHGAGEVHRQLDDQAQAEHGHPDPRGRRVGAVLPGVPAPPGGITADVADDDPQQRPPDDARDRVDQHVGDVDQDADEEVVLRPARAGRDERGDGHPEEARAHLLQGLVSCQPHHRDEQSGDEGGDHRRAQLLRGHQVGDDEDRRRQSGVDHAAPAADRLVEHLPVDAEGVRSPGSRRRCRRIPRFGAHESPEAARNSYRGLNIVGSVCVRVIRPVTTIERPGVMPRI